MEKEKVVLFLPGFYSRLDQEYVRDSYCNRIGQDGRYRIVLTIVDMELKEEKLMKLSDYLDSKFIK